MSCLNLSALESLVDVGATELPNQNGDRLLKIHKMLLERQKKLVKDESEVNSMLQKVTEMINNQRNHVSSGGSHGNRTPESARTPATVSDVFRTKKSDDFKSSKSHSEVSIPEEVSSAEKTNSEEIKEVSDKDASEYDNCTFESDSSPSRPPTTLQVSSAHVSQVQVDEEPSSLTETSDHSDYEEKIKKLKEQIQREKMKADELEKKKQKMKRSVMKKEVLKLEKELKNTREDIHRKRAEIKMAAVSSPTPPTLSSGKPTKISPVTPKKESSFSKQEDSSSKESAQETSYTFPSGKDFSESSVNEVEESLVEELDGPSIITTMKVVSKEDSPVSHQNGVSDVPEDISEHSDSDSAASKPDETRVGESERNLSSKVSDIPEIPEELHTQPQSSPDQSESIAEDLENFREKTPEISGEELKRSYTDRQSSTSIPEESLRIVEDSQDLRDKTETTDEVLEPSYTEPRSDTSIPEGSPSIAEDSPGSRKRTETPDEILQHSYTEPQSGMSIPEESPTVVDRSRATRKERPGFPDEALEHTNTKSGSDATVSDETSTDHEKPNDISEEISKKKSDSIFPEPNEQEDHEIRSLMSDFSEISENLPSAKEEEEHFSAESNAASERIRSRTQSPSSDNSDLQSRSLPKDTEPIQVLEVIDDVIAPEKSMLTVPGLSSNLAGKKDISEKQSRGIEHSEGHDGDEDDKSSSQASSIPEEIASAYEDEDISEHASSKGEPEGLIFGDINEGGKSDTEVKVNVNADYSDTFAPTSGGESKVIEPAVDEDSGGKEKSERSESSSSEKLSDVNKVETEQTTEPKGEEPQEEQQYSEDFEVDDESISEDIPESLELDEEVQGEDQKEDTFKVFDGEGVLPQETAQEDEPSAKGMLDDITEKIYREIMDDSFECMKSTKTMKSKRTGKKEELGDLQKASASNQSAGETVSSRRETAVTDNITKDLLAEAILQMMTIKQRKCKTKEQATPDTRQPKSPGKQNDSETFPKPSYTATTSSNKSPEYETSTSFIDVGPGFGIHDEQRTISNALMIAKDNQALDDDALKEMDADIEGLLGPSLDDEDEDFPVNENQITDIPSDETEQSIPEYSPMFAVPHNLSEMTSIVNCTLDVLLKRKGEGMPLTNCEPPAQLLGEDNENELESRSMRSYRKLIFDLTKEVLIDTVSQEELVTRPPWAKVKWKGGHKLSRNFKRWKSDDEVRAVVLERVTNLIGLGAPRTTMQTLQRKTPVRGNKKDNVDAILIEELREEEPQWTDYDDDETTVKFQVADSILNMLLDDTVRVFKAIEAKKNARANALIV